MPSNVVCSFYALEDIQSAIMIHQSLICTNIQIIIEYENIHKYIKYYNADFHCNKLLDTDVREVPSF